MDRLAGHLSQRIPKLNAITADQLTLIPNKQPNFYLRIAVDQTLIGNQKRHLQILQPVAIVKPIKSVL